MKKNIGKRAVALILALLTMLGTIASTDLSSVLASDALFEDGFSDANLAGWSSNNVGTVESGKYYLSDHESNVITGVAEQSKVKISANVTVNMGANQEGLLQNSIASVVAMTNKDMTQGYEFGIGVTKTGVTYMRLYIRGDEATSRILVQEYLIQGYDEHGEPVDVPELDKGKISVGKEYKLTMGVYEGVIQCFINDTLVISYKDATYSSGLCGIKTVWSKSSFDDVTIDRIEEKKVEKLTIKNAPKKMSMVGELLFDVDIDYVGSYHQTEHVSSGDSRLSISGFERSLGEKTISVSYGGKTASFKVKVVKKATETIVFSDDFSNYNKDNYTLSQTVNEKYNVTYAFNAANDVLRATVPALPTGFDSPLSATARIKADGIANLKNYYVSADATLHSDLNTPTVRRAIAEVSAFTDVNGKKYCFRVYSSGNLRLYAGSTLLLEKTIDSIEGATFAMGKPFNMAMYVTEGMLVCQYNGKDVLYYSGANMDNHTPLVRVMAWNGTVSFDNLKVCSLEKYAADAAKSFKIKTILRNDTISSCTGRYIDVSRYYLLVTYVNGEKKPVRLTEDMLVGYNPNLKKSQNINVTYGNVVQKFKFNYSEYLFYDTFDKTVHELWKFGTAENLTLKVKDGSLKSDWNKVKEKAAITGLIEGSDEWENFSISADVTFGTTMTKNTSTASYFSFVLNRTGKTFYDIRLVTRSGELSIRIYEYIDGKATLVKTYKSAALEGKLVHHGMELVNGQTYNFKALCKGDYIYLYLNNILVGDYTKTGENAPREGKNGIKASMIDATIDNVIVEEKGPRNIQKIAVEGLKDNVFEIYEGFEIEAYDYKLNSYDADGTVMTEVLTADMISPYDNLEPGLQNITISAHGLKQKAAVRVLQRDDYIKKVETDLEGLKVSKLKLKHAEKVDEILARYDELSDFEISKMSEKAVKNAKKARTKIESLRYPDIAKDDVIYTNTFTKEEECNNRDWSNGEEPKRGEWLFINGTYRNEQEYHGVSGSSLRVLKDVYGKISSVSARFKVLSPGMFAGVLLNTGMEGEYSARIKMNVYDENNEVIPMFQVLKGDTILVSEEFANYGVHIAEDEWFDVRMTYVDGIVSAYFNDTMVFSFDDSEEIINYSEGRAGVMISRANGKFDNFVVRGEETGVPTSVAKPTPTEYKDDFEGETANANPDYWVEHPSTDDWKTVSKDGNTYYGTSGNAKEAHTWIHVYEKDPTVSLDFMYDAKRKDSNIGFYVRRSPETAYVKFGYDVTLQKWYMIDTEAERDADINTIYSDAYELKKNEWHKLQIVGDDKYVSLVVDGETIFDKVEVVQVGYGRIGAYSENSALYIDNVKLKFPNGDIPQDGLIEYKMCDAFYDASVDIEVLDDNRILGIGTHGSYLSKDGGLSFDLIGGSSAEEKYVDKHYQELTERQGYVSMLQLHDGSFLYVHEKDFIVKKSTDGLKTWTDIGRVIPEDHIRDEQNRKNVIIHNNSLTEYQMEDGTWRIFMPVAYYLYLHQFSASAEGHYTIIYYSDDGGVTWQKSKTDSRDFAIDSERVGKDTEWAETKVVQCSDGSLRLYVSRSKYGCMQYSVSHDGGVTWEGQYPMPEMQVALSSYNVIQDKEDGSYYMIFVNNNPVKYGGTFHRTRLSLVHSKDGMNWEFLCDLERMSGEIYGNVADATTPLMQLVDPSITVDEDYVYVTVGLSDGTDPLRLGSGGRNNHQGLRPWLWRIEKDKLNARAWDASTVNDMMFVKSLEVTEPSKVRFGYGDMFSYLGGEVTATRLDGTTYTMDTARLYLYEEPDLFTLGKQNVVLYNLNGTQTSYEIEVVNKYNVMWKVTGEGTVKPQVNSVLEGDTFSVTIKPENFFQKAVITVNGERARLKAGKLVREDVMEDLNITVDFVQKGVMDYLLYISSGLLIVLCATVVVLYIKKKKETQNKVEE